MGALDVVGESVQAVTEVIIVASFGAYLAHRGILTLGNIKMFEKVLVEIFTPCLIIGKVIPHADPRAVLELWPLISVCGWNILWGVSFGYVLARCIFRRPDLQGVVQAALAFPNTISVCLTLALALARTHTVQHTAVLNGNVHGNTTALEMYSDPEDGTAPVFLGYSPYVEEFLAERATAAVMTSTVWWNLARWTVAYNLLSYDAGDSWSSRFKKVFNTPVYACIVAFVVGFIPFLKAWWVGKHFTAVLIVTAVNMIGRCMVPTVLVILGARVYNVTRKLIDDRRESLASGGQQVEQSTSDDRNIAGGLAHVPLEEEDDASMVDLKLFATGAEQHLQDLDRMNEPNDSSLNGDHVFAAKAETGEPAAEGMSIWIDVGIISFRQGICMLLGLMLVTGFTHFTSDVMVLIVAFLQTAGPPMINLAVMAGLHGKFENDVAQLLMVAYIASIVTWSVSIAMFLYMLKTTLGEE